MEKGIDIALIIGVILNLSKGADLILLPKQKEWVQEKFENLTIWLDDIKPISWFQVFTTLKAQKIFLIIGIIEFLLIPVIAYFFQDPFPTEAKSFQGFQIVALLIGFATLPFARNKMGLIITGWLVKHKSSIKFIFRFIIFIVVGYLFFIIYQIIAMGIVYLISSEPTYFGAFSKIFEFSSIESKLIRGSILLVWPIFTLFFVIAQTFGLLVYITIFIYLIELILRVLRGVFWRLVEYNKGAFSAVILVVTIVLSIYKLIGF